jgi:hemin uptake protein HemP
MPPLNCSPMNEPESTNEERLRDSSDERGAGSIDPALRTINSNELLHGAREVLIQHDEKIYRLQVTRNGKLILVK